MTDYQGNTRKEREKQQRPEKVIEKVVTGEVLQKPKGLGRKFKDVFLGGDAKQTARYVLTDVFFPAMRNLLFDIVTEGARRQIYGESTYRRRSTPTNYSRYSYNNPTDPRFQSQSPIDPRLQRTAIDIPRGRQNRHDIADFVIPDKVEADLVVERLIDIIEKYQIVSLADLHELLGLETSPVDYQWGWTYLGNLSVSQVRGGYLLELPLLEEIR